MCPTFLLYYIVVSLFSPPHMMGRLVRLVSGRLEWRKKTQDYFVVCPLDNGAEDKSWNPTSTRSIIVDIHMIRVAPSINNNTVQSYIITVFFSIKKKIYLKMPREHRKYKTGPLEATRAIRFRHDRDGVDVLLSWGGFFDAAATISYCEQRAPAGQSPRCRTNRKKKMIDRLVISNFLSSLLRWNAI